MHPEKPERKGAFKARNPLEAEATRDRMRQPRLRSVRPRVASETKIFFNERSRTEAVRRMPQRDPCLFALIIRVQQ